MERIKSQDAEGRPKAELALKTLMWLSTVKRPLTILELQHAIATTPNGIHLDELADTSFFTETCLGLATFDNETSIIRLVHLSVNEYLQERREAIFPRADGKLAVLCLSYLSIDEFRGSMPSTRGAFNKLTVKWPLLSYAIAFWGVHAAASFDVEAEKKTSTFLSCDSILEFWCQGFEYKRSSSLLHDGDLMTKYIIRNLSALHIAAIFGIKKLANDALEKRPSEPSPRDSAGRTPLMLAAAHGNSYIVELLLSRSNADVNCTDLEGKTAFGYAVRHSQVNIVQLLVSSAQLLDINTGSPFRDACEHLSDHPEQSKEILRLLLSRADLDVNPESTGDSAPWFCIARDGYIDMMQALLARKDFDPYRSGPVACQEDLFSYIKNSDYFGDMLLLTEFPIMVKLLDDDHRFRLEKFSALEVLWPFTYYAFNPEISWEVLDTGEYYYKVDWLGVWDDSGGTWRERLHKTLVSYGFSLNMTDSEERSLLHFVAQDGKEEYVQFLLQRGADVAAIDKLGRTAIFYAAENGHEMTVRTLLNAGALPSAVDRDGQTVVHHAARSGNASLVELLIDRGADVMARDKFDTTVLHTAVRSKEAESVITLLLSHGVEINSVDRYCNPPLFDAIRYEAVEACQLLLEKGADPNKCSFSGPALFYACQAMNEEIVRVLLSNSRTNPDVLDCCGRSGLDLIADCRPVAEKMAFAMAKYKPTPPSARKMHLLKCLQQRIDMALSGDKETRLPFSLRLGKQLLLLGDETSARILFETEISEESKSEEPFFPNLECDQCFTDKGLLFFCKTCPLVSLCPKCLADRKTHKAPWCQGHDFIQVPGNEWKDLPKGVVNSEGQSFEEWLKRLQRRYCTHGASDIRHLSTEIVANVKRQKTSGTSPQGQISTPELPK